jgi:hypothetical protein
MFMQSYPSRMVTTLSEGVERVRSGGYALLAETPYVQYVVSRPGQVEPWLFWGNPTILIIIST